MSPEERQLLEGLFERMRGSAGTPRDREAEQMIADRVKQQPYAPYLMAQTVIVQDQALQAANERLQQLEQEVEQARGQSQGGGFLSGLFGSSQPQQRPSSPPPQQRASWNQGATGVPPQGGPQPGYAPPPPPQQGGMGGPWGQQAQPAGGGFLRGALGTAAGVAGGVLAADAIGSLFRSGHAGGGLGIAQGVPGFGGGGGSHDTITNNYYGGSGDSANQSADASQDADFLGGGGGHDASVQNANWSQDANQDADMSQDMADYDTGGDDDFA